MDHTNHLHNYTSGSNPCTDELTDIDSIDESYFTIENYKHSGVIKAPMVV